MPHPESGMVTVLRGHTIFTSAVNGHVEKMRLRRLDRVVGFVYAFCGEEGISILKSLHDNKGQLTATWRAEPNDFQRGVVFGAWDSGIGDGNGHGVEHMVVPDEKF